MGRRAYGRPPLALIADCSLQILKSRLTWEEEWSLNELFGGMNYFDHLTIKALSKSCQQKHLSSLCFVSNGAVEPTICAFLPPKTAETVAVQNL